MKHEQAERKSFVDPVCGMAISFQTAAVGSEYRGKRYYFCSAACREQFEADPERYARAQWQHRSRRG
ncbi:MULTISPECIES: YHS domain-containing protein [Halomonadaceae]|uniref:YHS domain-containing protein n=2 Tax=Halomonadaceae TaxID=28256 RepID=A0A1I3EP68_9GAMM|nr:MULTISPECIES: YHS domain-containing protein [unclassified Halomonas]AJY52763.1 YHS domain-containing protein [Halomonas sp. KO116]MCD6009364.1 YHS domain-containing protein [Halomonas sp. IOP_31]NYS79143.1 YHS domain-containing protein [Halomonas glaciei]SFI00688.1 YHS domain-containing protein [Halomonas xianhensis]